MAEEIYISKRFEHLENWRNNGLISTIDIQSARVELMQEYQDFEIQQGSGIISVTETHIILTFLVTRKLPQPDIIYSSTEFDTLKSPE